MALQNPPEELQPPKQPQATDVEDQIEDLVNQEDNLDREVLEDQNEKVSNNLIESDELLKTSKEVDALNKAEKKAKKRKKKRLKETKEALKTLQELQKLKAQKIDLKVQEREEEHLYLSKSALNILRTVLRNNIDLTNIADNKANVLLSLNAIMLTFMVPLTVPYFDRIQALGLGVPLIIMALTCLVTIYLAVHVLKPGKLGTQKIDLQTAKVSPFFFGSAKNMTQNEWLEYSNRVLADQKLTESFISNDFYHISVRLAEKMKMVRSAFNIFIYGMSLSMLFIIIMLLIN